VFKRRLRGASGQLSLNFGHRLGWSRGVAEPPRRARQQHEERL